MHEVIGKVAFQDVIEMTCTVTECKADVHIVQSPFIVLSFFKKMPVWNFFDFVSDGKVTPPQSVF
jgi:hypothetical protein